MSKTEPLELAKISVRGVVQGVGFRPFVYQLADKHHLNGWVCNTSEDVKIEVEGNRNTIEQFYTELTTQAPALATIETASITFHPREGYKKFEIRHSISEEDKYQLISPDIATCQACLDELLDPDDRRYRYPFTNCTNCGPRFTIIEDIPYDRPNTTMRSFNMCSQCNKEYQNPLDRRFHAQPNACPKCGPKLELLDNIGKRGKTKDAIVSACQLLKDGNILAIKGLGGFLLACDATNDEVVELLRQRKRRPFKPLAIMVNDLTEARRHCYISDDAEKLLTSVQSPIVLLRWKQDSTICRSVSPNLKYLGVMLPYTPLHHILLKEIQVPLVMTSGNISEEPIAKDNDEAVRRLSSIADYFLVHNRGIYARYDDSVTMIERGDIQIIRRARGYAPYPIHLPFTMTQVLGCGAEEKNTFCLTRDNHAFISQHIGDMENMETMEHFENTIALYKHLFRIEPEIIAHDLHPEYLSTKYAVDLAQRDTNLDLIPVQHHHAHIVSCMVDNQIEGPVIGVAFDGTGYGSDGNIWGGEFLLADYRNFRRTGHLEYLPLPGGAAAIKKPYRIALSYLSKLLGKNILDSRLSFLESIDPAEIELVTQQAESGFNAPLTSSMGRLFDAVSALLGIRDSIDYEGQAAIELEMEAYEHLEAAGNQHYRFDITDTGRMFIVRLERLFSDILEDLYCGTPKGTISARFHNTIARLILEMCQLIAQKSNLKSVALSGGVFQNRLLLRKAVPLLESDGFSVATHRQVPCNDGGISLGQAVAAHFH
jgi:hydrogenase maturation protein HypF